MARTRVIDADSVRRASMGETRGNHARMLNAEIGERQLWDRGDAPLTDEPPLTRRPWTMLVIAALAFTVVFSVRIARDGTLNALWAEAPLPAIRVDTSWMRSGKTRPVATQPEALADHELTPAASREDPDAYAEEAVESD